MFEYFPVFEQFIFRSSPRLGEEDFKNIDVLTTTILSNCDSVIYDGYTAGWSSLILVSTQTSAISGIW